MIDYIEKNLGKIDITIGKILSGSGVDIDMNLIRPTKEKNYITLATNGMSSYPMRYSEKDNEFKYVELIFLLFNCVCRYCSAYFSKSKCKKYINIRNNRVADILIAKSISRDKFVEKYDYNKISVIGIIFYIFLGIPNLCTLILGIMKELILDSKLEYLYKCSVITLAISYMTFLFISEVNTSKCKNR